MNHRRPTHYVKEINGPGKSLGPGSAHLRHCQGFQETRDLRGKNHATGASHLSFRGPLWYDASMPVNDEFLKYVRDQLAAWGEVRAKRMFGGAGLYHQGIMFGLVADDVAYLKVSDANRPDFEAAGSQPFQPYKGQKTIRSYYEIPEEVLDDPDQLVRWAEKAWAVAKPGR